MSGNGCSGLGLASGDMNQIPNSAGNSSGPNIGANSLVTDANSALCSAQLQRCASFNNETYTRLPTSPISFSSNFSGSSVMDGCSTAQQNLSLAQMQKQGLSGATSQLTQQDLGSFMNAQKKPRIDGRHEDVLHRQSIQQLFQRHEPIQAHGQQNMQQAILQHQRLLQQQRQQQIMQSFSQMQRVPVRNLQQQHLQPQALQLANPVKQTIDNGICYRKLMQYLYHKRHRPRDNTILYWRKFVSEYFAPQAKKRWCLSLYENMGNHALGIFPQLAIDAWQCDICASKSRKGFEATFEVLPRLFQIKFDGGVIDENLFLDMPHEGRLPSGIMVLKFEKAVEETVYEHLHTIREGQLRILFTPELKILLWEFCSRRHEEFLSRRLLAPQVNQLLHVAQKYQAAITENSSSAVLHQDLQASCNMFAATGRQLLKSLDLQAVNDFGFSKRYVRCLQIAEVVSSMKDLIDFSLEQKIGAIESLKSFPRQSVAEIQKQKLEGGQLSSHSLSGDLGSLDKDVKVSPGSNSYINDNLVTTQVANSSHQSVHALNNYQNMLRHTVNMKQNVLHQEASSSLDKSLLQQEASSSLSKSKHALSLHFLGSGLSGPTDASNNNLTGQHQHQFPLDGCLSNSYSPRVNQNMQQHVIQQMLQEMMNNSKETPQQSIVPVANANLAAGDVNGCDTTSMPIRIDSGSFRNALDMQNHSGLPKEGTGAFPSRNDCFKSAAAASVPSISGNCLNSRTELLENLDFTEIDQIAQEFIDGGMFDGDSW
ncbi:probable transcriptional regulator SLK2 [Zingiber officinale]|uniref:Transcriptional regulator SLK2 n=1 Tax=Zingiber officinale TaxID=94328 RepID=A0A8J5IDL4_ZINOF|nr:probable transcriptional regulator SLK2 [Zingiber officinale]XP_042454019.1 probable transcriptional regulator SLK2 [Zingiber officinale]XP_042454020.1 probable transcriptional regulator SLK2 [Zingiber officinale]KAG6538495.1 hypothetical protein ZIOFF_003618 [Zingiber officinale]